jgi:fluoride exporter
MISTYLWVAVGGALGSMARFWLAAFVATILGPQFPWGTILINIVGSFVIGFFATFTGPGGRYVASFDLRAFVMVGICGGFTTFSAFSLQTLDLARESRWLQAGGNVVLSVVVCLLAVWAGHMLASALNPARQ